MWCVLVLLLFASAYASYDGNYALTFDGVDDIVMIQHTFNDIMLDDFWTVEAWFKPDANQPDKQPNLVGFPGRHPNLNYCGPGNIQCTAGDAIAQLRNNLGAWFTIVGDATRATPYQWHHIAGSWNNQTLYLFIDGKIDGSQTPYSNGYIEATNCETNPTNFDCDYGIQIGGNWLRTSTGGIYSQQYFLGSIDEVRIWKKGRTQQEIVSTMYSTLTGSEAGLLFYWRFDEGDGIEAKSLAYDAYGLLGGGNPNAIPRFTRSDAPISAPPPGSSTGSGFPWDPIVVHDTASAVVGGALVSLAILFISGIIGFFVGRRTHDRPFPYFWASHGEMNPLISK
jgi:hypothetical protein